MWRNIREVIVILLLTVLFASGIKSCIVDAYVIPSDSMKGTILSGDCVLVNKFIYGARTPSSFIFIPVHSFTCPPLKKINRGDVIVFEFPGERDEVFPSRHQILVKRCIGLPGDTVGIGSTVTVNGAAFPGIGAVSGNTSSSTIVPFAGMTVPLDPASGKQWKVFIEREGHTVEQRDQRWTIDGEETSLYTVRKNYYFVLGDNVNNSYDSRYWGYVPEENIVGQVMVIYWSRGTEGIRWERVFKKIR